MASKPPSGRVLKTVPGNLTDKEKRLCQEYLVDSNVSAAAKRVNGWAPTSRAPYEVLKKPEAMEYLDLLREASKMRLQVTADRVIEELAAIAFSSVQSFTRVDSQGQPFLDMRDMTDADWAAVSEVDASSGKIKTHSKIQALVKLAEHFGVGVNPTGDGSLEPVDPKTMYLDMMDSVPECYEDDDDDFDIPV